MILAITDENSTAHACETHDDTPNVLEVAHLKKYFNLKKSLFGRREESIKAVDDVSFSVPKGETLGLVGESGSGKSTIGLTIAKLYEPTSGSIFFKSTNITTLKPRQFKEFRKNIQIVLQNPISSLDPRMKVSDIVAEPLKTQIRQKLSNDEIRRAATEALLEVGLDASLLGRYQHELSGGQAQRVAIARSLITNPQLLILDEPTSALDVSIQAQIINLLKKLQRQYRLTYLFISHDLGVVNYVSSRIAVMYLGKIVELAPVETLFRTPLHPYTQALISSVPTTNPDRNSGRQKTTLSGEIPSPRKPPSGCRFHTRCPLATEKCKIDDPQLVDYGGNHYVACHRVDESKKFAQEALLDPNIR